MKQNRFKGTKVERVGKKPREEIRWGGGWVGGWYQRVSIRWGDECAI